MSNAAAFEIDRTASEGLHQADMAAAQSAFMTSTLQAALRSADRAHFCRVLASAVTNGMECGNERAALTALWSPGESVSQSDGTAFALQGGRYVVKVAGTFAGGGSIELQDANGVVYAHFDAGGSVIRDLRYRTDYTFVIASVTAVTATVSSAQYGPGVP